MKNLNEEIVLSISGDSDETGFKDLNSGEKPTSEETAKLFQDLPARVREECQDIFAGLDEDKQKLITSSFKSQSQSVETPDETFNVRGVDRLIDELKKAEEKRRHDKGIYNREEIKKMNSLDIELLCSGNIRRLYSDEHVKRTMGFLTYTQFETEMNNFVGSIWDNRGRDENKMNIPQMKDIEKADQESKIKQEMYDEMHSKLEMLLARKGKRKRIPNDLAQEIKDVTKRLEELKHSNGYQSYVGDKLKDQGKIFQSTVYFSEYFSSEEFAILMYETISRAIDIESRYFPHADPELLDYCERYFRRWAELHSETKLLSNEGNEKPVDASEKARFLAQKFADRLQSYLRHKDNSELAESHRDSLAAELPVVLNILKRV